MLIVVLRNVSHTPLLWRRKTIKLLGRISHRQESCQLRKWELSPFCLFRSAAPQPAMCHIGTYSICCTPQFPEFDAGKRSNSKQDSAFFSGTLRGKGDRAEIYDPSPPLQIEDQNFPLLLCLNCSAALIYKGRNFFAILLQLFLAHILPTWSCRKTFPKDTADAFGLGKRPKQDKKENCIFYTAV